MIRYKVVTGKRRSLVIDAKSKYSIHYLKGKIAKADPKTFGIFCFKTLKSAKQIVGYGPNRRIIRVKPLVKGKAPKNICIFQYTKDLNEFYNSIPLARHTMDGGFDVSCYQKVKVLD